jgi:ketosteroid isomerase-like protein
MMEAANRKEVIVDRRENNLGVIRGFYDAAARADVSAVLDLLDPEIEWRSPESLPWGGTYHGSEGVREELSKLFDQPVEFRREAREWFDEGDRVVVLLRVFGRHKGADTEFGLTEIHIWSVRDGKIASFEGIFDTATALREWQLQPKV